MTDPNNALSVTRILSLQRTNETNVLITFPTVAGRTYTLRSAPTLTNAFTNTGLPAQPGTGSPRTFTNTVGTNIVSRFYKVQAGLSGVVAPLVKAGPWVPAGTGRIEFMQACHPGMELLRKARNHPRMRLS